MNETKPKKMVSRNVATALGIISIVLAVSLGSVIVHYIATNSNRDYLIVNLKESDVWVNNQTMINQPALSPANWTFEADYAGFVTVQVYNSTGSAYARVLYSYQGLHYANPQSTFLPVQQQNQSTVFPVVPGSIEIRVAVGGGVAIFANTVENYTVTITYYY